ncbi:MAG: DoxX family protein [Bacteroidaceae bacterium]|nr:DoxX family protein [Bacteroidaceae bacterium]
MKQSLAHIASSISINALRFALALVFAFSGIVKAIDPMGTVYKLGDYAEAFGLAVPFGLLLIGAMLLIIWEYVMGICLFFGIYRRFHLVQMIAFLAVMTPLTYYLALHNPVTDCGCFGDAVVLTNWQTFGKNVVLLLMAIISLIGNKFICRIISERVQWLAFVYAVVSLMVFMPYSLRHLPIVDFRPYHVGANIIEGMTIPEGAPQDEYETLFVLEKDGEQRTFTFDDYPDSTWTFVSRENRLVSKGYVPPITDFYITDLNGEDFTWELLEQPGYTFLVVAPNLNRSDEGMLDVINDLHDYAKVNDYAFYMLTSSGAEAIAQWIDHTGASYPYLQADEILLKTMIRANPGLILLKDGIVIGKWSKADMPRDGQLMVAVEDNVDMQITSHDIKERQMKVALWMFLPLLLLIVIDLYLKKNNNK